MSDIWIDWSALWLRREVIISFTADSLLLTLGSKPLGSSLFDDEEALGYDDILDDEEALGELVRLPIFLPSFASP